ncbi:hypothetical protein EDD53_1234 [Pacificibacter maritimus]|uniref:Cyclopropane-fatty-acyl-phospholipid synthase n=1 Tax=Pacificibacter maritimus TaxID=762213 RepID=A0A3N4UWZ3_9RHOB|nr:DUF1365 domain-containing protein [Pacificibacter maritimus]RPE72091.1 hypothetical protein EDD53_1234 [Pacificibacter maritimus]
MTRSMRVPEHIIGHTSHARRGAIQNAFRYGVDFVLIDLTAPEQKTPFLFSRNRFNLASVYDEDHGGPIKSGAGVAWAQQHFAQAGLAGCRVDLLTQPRFLGYGFNPVSFWLAWDGSDLRGVIAEVSTPFKDRHSYLCVKKDRSPITKSDTIFAPKSLHVSPFQNVKGDYQFTFDITPQKIAIRILHKNGDQGVVATLSGPRAALTTRSLLRAAFRRPFGALRTMTLIHWQALVLKLKGATYRRRPNPPSTEITKTRGVE